MTMFEEREDTYEKKFIHDEELRFKIFSRRNRLLSHWAAQKAGLNDEMKAEFAQNFIFEHMQSSEGQVAQALMEWLEKKNISCSSREIRTKMAVLWEAASEVITGSPTGVANGTFLQ